MSDALPRSTAEAIEALNRECFCLSLDQDELALALGSELGRPGLFEMLRERCPYVFAARPVFVAAPRLQRMAQVVQAVESVVALPAFREPVLAAAPAIARHGGAAGPRGVFFGYDFHLDQGRLDLIEINTNAGGAMLNAVLARAQRACCAAMESMVPTQARVAAFERHIVSMFREEWRLAGQTRPLASIAVVDATPDQQYLYPEFLLFQQLFERHGIRAVVADPATLEWRGGALWHGDLAIDLVYNRLTDFYLEEPCNAPLRAAYLDREVVLTPHPQAHALYADKRHLALFSDAARLRDIGVPADTQRVLLEHVPHTEIVDLAAADRLWAARRGLFFKPVGGYGSRAAYRGDKVTRRVWQEILNGKYVAQAIATPGERRVSDDAAASAMKFDLRAYTYGGTVQWVAARLYQGQTTNFRTPGGGFAPVYSTSEASGRTVEGAGGASADDGYASYAFLIHAGGDLHTLPHALYVALARGEAAVPALAGARLRLADWYVRLKGGEPDTVVNETYRELRLDAQGRVDRTNTVRTGAERSGVTASVESEIWPSPAQRARMRQMLFGTWEPTVRSTPVPT